MSENTYQMEKKLWQTPIITEGNMKKIREEDMEN